MNDKEQIDALKAQVNCLREALLEQRSRYHVAKDLDAVLEANPEQCLAEVKAKAIEEYKNQLAESKQLDLSTKILTITI